jgi:hypothetical protein
MEEEKGKFIAFDLETRAGQPSDATKYKKYIRKFEEGNPPRMDRHAVRLGRDLDPEFYDWRH